MIQRIQTLYLLVVVILGTLLCFFSPVYFMMTGTTEYPLNIMEKLPMAIMTIASPVLALLSIFLFKHRLLQVRINIMNVIMCLGFYALLALYTAYVVKGYEPVGDLKLLGADWYVTLWASIPLINLILLMMATRRILKDEALVRAANRLR
jgi:hypothetical protein